MRVPRTLMFTYPWLSKWVWFVLPYGDLLHHVADPLAWDVAVENGGYLGRSSCGRRGRFSAPGWATRVGASRCNRCCRALGIPPGVGSGLNDPSLVEHAVGRAAFEAPWAVDA